MKNPTVYILSNKNNTVLYIGVTSNLTQRVRQHKEKFVDGFTKKYNLNKLVYFETHLTMENAIVCEKQLKKMEKKLESQIN